MDGTLTVSYSHTGRPGVAPERRIRAFLLQLLYSIRSERQLAEQFRYNMLFRWFVGLSLDDAIWDATTFTKNRQRFIDDAVTGRLLHRRRSSLSAPLVVRAAFLRGWHLDRCLGIDGQLSS